LKIKRAGFLAKARLLILPKFMMTTGTPNDTKYTSVGIPRST